MKRFLLTLAFLPLLIFSGCAGTGANGAWTAADTQSALGAVDQGLNTYQHAQALYNGQSYPVAPQPTP